MSVFASLILDALLSAVVVATIVGLLVWSVLTQNRDSGGEDIRLSFRRPRLWIGLEELEARAARDLPERELSLSQAW
jgi:hypothetical protein